MFLQQGCEMLSIIVVLYVYVIIIKGHISIPYVSQCFVDESSQAIQNS